jgi:hypothetical protein
MNSQIEELRALLRATPFRAFTIVTTEGTRVPVRHAGRCALTPKGSILFESSEGALKTIPPDAIVELIVEPQPSDAQLARMSRIRDLHAANPFVPFAIVVNDGRQLRVEQPYVLSIAPNDREICYAKPPLGFERISAADVREVVNGRG